MSERVKINTKKMINIHILNWNFWDYLRIYKITWNFWILDFKKKNLEFSKKSVKIKL